MINTPFLSMNSIFLRGLCLEDADGNYPTWFNSSEICLYNSHHRFPYTKEEAVMYIESLAKDKSKCVFAIVCSETLQHIGNVSLQDIDYISRSAHMGIIIGERKFWGKGASLEAMYLIITHGFNQLNLHRIEAGISVENAGGIAVLERVGFIREGVRRKAHYKNGHYCDIIEFGILKSEWDVLNEDNKLK